MDYVNSSLCLLLNSAFLKKLKSYFNGLQLNIGSYVKMNTIFVLKIYTLLNIEHKLEYK